MAPVKYYKMETETKMYFVDCLICGQIEYTFDNKNSIFS